MKKLLAIIIMTVFVLGIGVTAYAEEATTATKTKKVQPVKVKPPKPVKPETVAKNVYGTKEGYIVSVSATELVLSKADIFTATLKMDSATKIYKVGMKNKKLQASAVTLADLKAGQKALVRYTTADKKVVFVKILPGKTPDKEMKNIKRKAHALAMQAKAKIEKIKKEAIQKIKEAEEKAKIKAKIDALKDEIKHLKNSDKIPAPKKVKKVKE